MAVTTAAEQQAVACESLQDIINIAATAEAFAVTALGGALDNAAKGLLALNAEQQQTLRAARAEEKAHYDFLIGAGAKPSTLTFTIPDPKIVTDVPTFLKTLVTLEEAFIAAYIAAAQEFAILGQAKYAQVALQIGAVEAEHRAGVRFYAIQAGALTGTPNDVAFEKALFASVGEAAAALQKLGFIGGSGPAIVYPGPGTIDPTNVIERTPGGPVVACAAPAPSASPSPSATPKPSASPSPVPTATPMPSTPTPMPMPGLPNTGGGGGSSGQGTIATLGALGLGAAAAGALALRRNRQSAATGNNDER